MRPEINSLNRSDGYCVILFVSEHKLKLLRENLKNKQHGFCLCSGLKPDPDLTLPLMTRCQILGSMRLHCVSKTLTPRRFPDSPNDS